MPRANIHDRSTIEAIYPPAVFAREANANARAKASVLRGLSIRSAPDETGAFELVRAARHAGETEIEGGAIFLCPFAQGTGENAQYPARAPAAPDDPARCSYDRFIDEVLAAAPRAPLMPTPGRGDVRLKGLRQ
jgi:plasmid stability protein